MSSRYLSSHTKSLAALACYSLLLTSVAPFGRTVEGHSSRRRQIQVNGATPRPGAPEGAFPNLDEVKSRQHPRPRVPVEVPSTIRARRNPLVPRNGRRVGDPFPSPSPLSSPLPLPSASPLPSRVGRVDLEKWGSPSWTNNGRANSAALQNLLAWNLHYFKAPFSYFSTIRSITFDELTSGSGRSVLGSSRETFPESTGFDFFAVPMPQAPSSKIIFTSNGDGNAEIYSMDLAGGNLLRLTNNPFNDDNPRWSPNGARIIFQSDRDNPETGNYDVYVMNADGSGQTRLTYDAADDSAAVWSADGSRIAFQSLRNGLYYQVYVMNADGTNQVNITNGIAADFQPSWSPDGTKIAFASERDHAGRPSVYVMNVSGANQTRLTFPGEPFRDEQPVWSRDGSRMAFVSTRDSIIETWQETDDDGGILTRTRVRTNKEVYLMNADGTNQVRLTNTLENDDSPYWSPDGTKIMFRGERERECCDPMQQLWTMNSDGTNQSLVKDNVYGDYSPSWMTTGNQPPVANTAGPYNGMTAQTVQFNGSASYDPDGSITSYAWNFGDNTSGSGVSPAHVYASVGNYTVTLTVADNLGTQASATTTANITTNGMEQYMANFSQWAMLRQPNANESVYWNDIFRSAYLNGPGSLILATREFGKTIFESSEYAARNRSDHDYVYDLYKTYLMREPDTQGWEYWTAAVPLYGREHVRRGFDESTEFLNLMATMTANGSISSAVSSLSSARVDPKNQPGNGLQARDAEWSLPLLSLPGRAGLDLGLSLSYSSMVWTRSGPYVYFDEDNGSPSPGFRLGFPTIQEKFFDAQVGRNVYLLTTPGGRRVELRQAGSSNVYEAADSSYLQLIDNGSLLVRSTDGTQLNYGWFNHEFRCTEIKDRNGNYLTVNYNWLGDITSVGDTLGRVITFNYDSNANPISITQSWTVSGVPQTHTWATFGWSTLSMQSSFSGVAVVGAPNGSTIPVLSQVGLDDGSRFTFEYTGAAQASVIRSYRSDNVQRAYTAYDYQTAGDDCPRLSATRVWAENWTGLNGVPSEVTTQYSEPGDGSRQLIAPDGTIYKEFYGGSGSSPVWQKGLPIQTEVWSGGVRQKWTTTAWTQDNTGVSYQTNPRMIESNVYDSGGNRRRVTIDYGQYAQYGLPYLVREYAADGITEIRHNFTDYNLSQPYLDRRIIGLVSAVHLTDVASWQGKVTYSYDDPARIQSMPAAATQHDQAYSASFTTRGNVTSVSRWDVTDINNATKALTTLISYNTAGAVVSSADPLGHQGFVSYADSFSDGGNSRNTFAYPTSVTDAGGFSSSVQYNFDFGGKTRVQGPPPAGQPQGVIQTLTYDSAARIDRVTTTNNGAYTRYVYGPNYVQQFGSVNNLADDSYAIQVFDGAGRVIGAARNHPGSVGGYSMVNTIYDLMGRASKQSNPGEINSSWVPSGDDAAAGLFYTQQTYNWQGRPLVTTNTDGTTKEATYSGCGCAGGEVVTLTDEGTIDAGVFKRRQQRIYSDVLGRTVKTELLNWQGGSVYSANTTNYNARDQVTLIRQFAGPEGSSTYQETTMDYDGYGRLTSQKKPEQTSPTTYNYNSDSAVSSVTDARGATQTLSYNARHLLTNITYAAPTGITVPEAVSYGYDGAGNRTSMTDGLGSISYIYDQLSRLTSESRTFTGVGTFPLSYGYNLAGQLTGINDSFGAQVNYNHDERGKLTGVTGSGYGSVSTYASNIQYRAWGAMKHLTYGNNRNMDAGYNARLKVTSFSVSGVMGSEYQYDNDGRIRYVRDLLAANSPFDRGYRFDHAGGLTGGTSGSIARGASVDDGPYQETFSYDVWGNLTSRAGTNWAEPINGFAATYTNNRREGWTYDADGRPTQQETLETTYDAAGHRIRTFDSAARSRFSAGLTIAQNYDGNGVRVKQQQNTNTPTYYLRSSALGGDVLTEVRFVNGAPVKVVGYVYAAGQLLAKQELNEVRWLHIDPRTENQWQSNASTSWGIAQVDPLGVDAGLFPPPPEPPEPPEPSPESDLIYPRYADMLNGSTGCTLDGAMVSCDLIAGMPEGSTTQLPPGVSTIQIVINHNTGNLHLRGTSLFIDGNTGNVHSSRNRSWVEDDGEKTPDGPDGTAPDGTPIIRTTGNSEGLGHWEYTVLWSPQNTLRALSRNEVSSLVGDIRKLFKDNPGCEGWTNRLLSEMKASTGFDAGTIGQILENFVQTGTIYTDGSVNGTGSGSAGTGIGGRPGVSLTYGTTTAHTAITLMHEIIHWAGMPAQGGGYGNYYTDASMAAAWNKLGVTMSVADYRSTYPDVVAAHTKRDGYDYAESRLAGAANRITCLGEKNGVRTLP